ncbi:MAG: ribonuclease Z [Bacteroidales bacterium]|nr:ribonuclease Z [Bacteroidales bacterium]
MARFQINILGCGSAKPSTRHLPSCQVVDYRDRLLMIDCGEGAQQAMCRQRLNFSRLTDIFISHLHGDHFLGLPGLLATLSLQGRGGSINVHLPAEGMEVLRSFVGWTCRDFGYDIRWNALAIEQQTVLDLPGMTVEAFPLYHRVPCLGYIFREKPKQRHLRGDMAKWLEIPVAQLRAIKEGADYVKEDGTVVPNALLTTDADPSVSYAYCSDTMMDPRVAEAVKGVDTLYHEATYLSDLEASARERGHSTAQQAGIIARMAGVRQLIIGHYSQRYRDVTVLVEEAKREFECVLAADEGMKIDLL